MGTVIYLRDRRPAQQQGVVGNGFVAYLVAVFTGLGLIGLGAFCVLGGVTLIWLGLQTLP